jgi:dolichol kinase
MEMTLFMRRTDINFTDAMLNRIYRSYLYIFSMFPPKIFNLLFHNFSHIMIVILFFLIMNIIVENTCFLICTWLPQKIKIIYTKSTRNFARRTALTKDSDDWDIVSYYYLRVYSARVLFSLEQD